MTDRSKLASVSMLKLASKKLRRWQPFTVRCTHYSTQIFLDHFECTSFTLHFHVFVRVNVHTALKHSKYYVFCTEVCHLRHWMCLAPSVDESNAVLQQEQSKAKDLFLPLPQSLFPGLNTLAISSNFLKLLQYFLTGQYIANISSVLDLGPTLFLL